MNKWDDSAVSEEMRELARLVLTLHEIQDRIAELSGDQVDAVIGPGGVAHLLPVAQHGLRHEELEQRRLATTLESILNALPAQIALIDLQGVILAVNAAWRDYAVAAGFAEGGDHVGVNYLEVCERTQGQQKAESWEVAAGIRAVLAGAQPRFEREYTCHGPHSRQWFRLTVTPVDGPRPRGAVVMHLDISDERRAQEALRESEERFRLLSRATNDALWSWDLRTDSLWWNEGFERVFGYDQQDGSPSIAQWHTLIHPDDRNAVLSELHHVLGAADTLWAREYRFQRRDGSYAFVLDRGHIIRDDTGRALRIAGGMTDITDRKQAESRLAEQAALLNQASDAILVIAMDESVQYWNRGAERLYGLSVSDALGKGLAELLAADAETIHAAMRAVRENGAWTGDLVTRVPSGPNRVVFARWTLLHDDEGGPKSILAIHADVTQSRQLQEQLLRSQRLESLGSLAGGIAHDLNNAIAPVVIATDLLREEFRDPHAAPLLDSLRNSAERARNLVQQILVFARGETQQRVQVDLRQVAAELQRFIGDTFPKSISITLELPETPLRVHAEPTKLFQVLMNLCVNARDAMPEGGALTVAADSRTLPEGAFAGVTVRDTGSGMPREVLARAAEPFFSTKGPGRGSGIGLSTALGIVQDHGGYLELDSVLGEGTVVTVLLPLAQSPGAANPAPAPPGDMPHGAGECVLLVDDEDSARAMTKRALEWYGYRVLEARNGAEGFEKFSAHRGEIDAVMTDVYMPVMDGHAMLKRLLEAEPHLRVVVSSGLMAQGDMPSDLAARVRHFLPKPYTAMALLKTIREVLDDR